MFADAPTAGAPKPRLALERGEIAARTLAAGFLADVADTCGRWRAQQLGADLNRKVVLYVHHGVEHPAILEAARRAGGRIEEQEGPDPAARLRRAFEAEHERGARAVCAIGTHAPSVPAHLLDEAFRALVWERAVLGPTFEGGCWLVGAQRPAPDVFTDMPWSEPDALARTVERLRAAGVEPHLLPFWYDVEDADDLARLTWHLRSLRARHAGALPSTWRALDELGLAHEGGEP